MHGTLSLLRGGLSINKDRLNGINEYMWWANGRRTARALAAGGEL